MARRVAKNHYVASPRHNDSPTPVHVTRSAAYSDGEDSQRTLSEYTSVPYTVVNERNGRTRYHNPPRAASVLSRGSGYDNGSDIYVTSGAYKAPSEISRGSRAPAPSHYSYRSGRSGRSVGAAPSVASTTKTRTSRKAGVTVETMAAPNPFCPNIRGMCCLMLLLNLAIVLVTLGFVIVIQFFEPLYVWILGIIFLIFGFLTLIGSIIYCVIICKDVKSPAEVQPEDLYWTHHWQKHIGTPEIHYKAEEKYPDDRYSDRYSVSKLSAKYDDRNGRY
ncbi:uncharacterized protein LOC109600049 [Aethina tumida]|uniref:uncharacterized protein LOC109600049 n=1 Tax=Aethina tumida TaxID=116153 RepID=UPI00096ADF45|nr:uncharacterized protein LOC109600049 [Aethina tumida]XP_019871677.1 uncharacterized protein LOC109600049 [Aethina tumida]